MSTEQTTIKWAARAVDYVRWSRRPEALTGRHPRRTAQAGA
ncbi:hypothetical protein [Kitasatospora sp. NBC_00315]